MGVAILAGAPIGPAAPAAMAHVPGAAAQRLPYGPAIAIGGLWVAAHLAGS